MKNQRFLQIFLSLSGMIVIGTSACTINVPQSPPLTSPTYQTQPSSLPSINTAAETQRRKEATRTFCRKVGSTLIEVSNYMKAHPPGKSESMDELISQFREVTHLMSNASATIQNLSTDNVDADAVTAAAEVVKTTSQFSNVCYDFVEFAEEYKAYAAYNNSPEKGVEVLFRLLAGKEASDLIDEHLEEQRELYQHYISVRNRLKEMRDQEPESKAKILKLRANLRERYDEDLLSDEILR